MVYTREDMGKTGEASTRSAFLWANFLNAPFWALFNMLPFILYRDLHATPFQVTLIIALKPAAALISPYWSSWIEKRPDRLCKNIAWARFLSHLPFFFFPWIENIWFYIASFACYMFFSRGTIPAWMELLKQHLPSQSRSHVFAYGNVLNYCGLAFVPFLIGPLMDRYFEAWRWLFPLTAFVSLSALLSTWKIPQLSTTEEAPVQTLTQKVMHPWKHAWHILRSRPDFLRFQFGFMLGGAGLIIFQPALPAFFMDVLHISYTELAIALTLCKGMTTALSSPLWAFWLKKVNIFKFTSWVTLLAAVFPLVLLLATFHGAWLYIAYMIYGFMQAGSEMSWNLSGPLFAKEQDSTIYSTINVLTVGFRGCVIPALGSILLVSAGSVAVMVLGSMLCLLSFAVLTISYNESVAYENT